tara:strand:+ start:487 stop:666 length:180 start_codon:yes stop_codon:yes gene_type:complete
MVLAFLQVGDASRDRTHPKQYASRLRETMKISEKMRRFRDYREIYLLGYYERLVLNVGM